MSTARLTSSVALIVKMTAKPGMEGELSDFLVGALELADNEPGTLTWFALQTDPSTFWIVDSFASEEQRQAHLDGPIAAALMGNAERLLAVPPEISSATVLAAKIP